MTKKIPPILPGLCLSLLFLLPFAAFATTLTVDPNATSCSPPCYTSITAAMNAAAGDAAVDLIILEPAVYSVSTSIALRSGVSLQGRETARTVLSGTGSNTIISAENISQATVIRNLTFTNAAAGIAVTTSTQLDIVNNVFRLPGGIGISTQNSAPTGITNNTFHDIGTAISTTTDSTLNIINNIFSAYSTAFPATIATAGILNNLFTGAAQSNVDILPAGNGNIDLADPLFADVNAGDFHLRAGSPAIDAGASSAGNDAVDNTAPDIGAYGGNRSDTIPFPVSGLIVDSSTASSITVAWNTSTDYRLAGYNVYYGTVPETYPNGPLDAGILTTYTLSGLSAATGPTGVPVLSSTVANHTLSLAWQAVAGATGYEIRYAIAPATPLLPPADDPNAIDVGNVSQYQLNGLQNGTTYNVIVIPYATAVYYVIVKAYYDQTDVNFMSAPSNVVQQNIGDAAYGAASNTISDYPEAIVPNPNLPNSGCFIATAAYGSYSASQVRALRLFRDRYLLTSGAGRTFVRWYYTYGPAGARFLNDHPSLKPVVRTVLLPAVGCAMFMTRTSGLGKAVILSILTGGLGYFLHRRKYLRLGGRQ